MWGKCVKSVFLQATFIEAKSNGIAEREATTRTIPIDNKIDASRFLNEREMRRRERERVRESVRLVLEAQAGKFDVCLH